MLASRGRSLTGHFFHIATLYEPFLVVPITRHGVGRTRRLLLRSSHDQVTVNRVSKRSGVFLFGGGHVNSQCGVIPSLIYRGLSLAPNKSPNMGMLDAAIDFKLAVKHLFGKSLVGFHGHGPRLSRLSLWKRLVVNGISEVLKHDPWTVCGIGGDHCGSPSRRRGLCVRCVLVFR